MRGLYKCWLALLLLLVAVQPGFAAPEQDIVAIDAVSPLPEAETIPGIVTGQRLMFALKDALDMVSSGVLDAARPGLEILVHELQGLQTGQHPESPLPVSYWSGNELWLPVRAERLKVRLDVPDLRLRPDHDTDEMAADMPARAQRITWLPVGRSVRLVAGALSQLDGGRAGGLRAQRLLEEALHGVRSQLRLQDRNLVLAYYQIEAALGAAHHWDPDVRSRLRRAAETLKGQPRQADLAAMLQRQADRLTPELGGLQQLAMMLRKRIAAAAETISGPTAKGTGQ